MKIRMLTIVAVVVAVAGLAAAGTPEEIERTCPSEAVVFDEAQGMTEPEATYKEDPRYPESAKEEGLSGVVVLETVIDRTGTVDDVSVLRDPDPRLSAAAVSAVRNWRFKPALSAEGKAIDVCYVLTFKFALEGKPGHEG
ncbi:MAG TPA: energy transducer TonB [Candidatus Sulfomarinibacteraceae bacterium]|nr:energy transducer TonB [Candidatus Sulfomarinibacteraceae bacterium]